MAKAKEKILRIKIQLKGSKPPIWRRVLVRNTMALGNFHLVIQTVMGWTDYHLHAFFHEGYEYGIPDPDSGFGDDMKNENRYKIGSFLKNPKDKLTYVYDFGDNWEHVITLEEVLDETKEPFLPVCTAGKMACPPEDCGGITGFYNMLVALEDGNYEGIEGLREWLGDDYDPELFFKDDVSEFLKEIFGKK